VLSFRDRTASALTARPSSSSSSGKASLTIVVKYQGSKRLKDNISLVQLIFSMTSSKKL
jgi:hypothetical protein